MREREQHLGNGILLFKRAWLGKTFCLSLFFFFFSLPIPPILHFRYTMIPLDAFFCRSDACMLCGVWY